MNFTIGDNSIEIVDEFRYLGFTKHIKAQQVLLGNSAMFSVMRTIRRHNLPIDMQLDLFDKMVMPVMLYGCETWGFSNLKLLERLHLRFCKIVLKLRSTTPDLMVYGETGRFKIEYYVKKRMINYWSTIACGNRGKLAYIVFKLCKQKYEKSS